MSAVSKYYTELTIKPKVRKTLKTKNKIKVNWTVFIFASVLISLTLIIILYLCNCVQLVDVQNRIGYLTEEKEKLSRQIDILNLKTLNLQSYERIHWEAQKRLGMIKPVATLVLNISTAPVAISAGNYFAMEKSSSKAAISR